MNLDWLAEQKIIEAVRAGEFDDLSGAGQPLPPDPLDPLIPSHLRAGLRILGNSGCPPLEVVFRARRAELDKQLDQLEKSRIDRGASGQSHSVFDKQLAVLRLKRLHLAELLGER